MANRWSNPHGKISPKAVPFTWQPTIMLGRGHGRGPETAVDRCD